MQKLPAIKTTNYLASAILWLLIVTILLSLPGSAIPKQNWMDEVGVDKLVHVGLFAILVVLWNRSFLISAAKIKKQLIVIAGTALAYGIAMEFVQKYFISNRSFDGWDILADAAGTIGGYFLALQSYKKINPCRNRGRNQN